MLIFLSAVKNYAPSIGESGIFTDGLEKHWVPLPEGARELQYSVG